MEFTSISSMHVLLFLILLATITWISRALAVDRYVEEPPYIPSRIPYFGHAVGLFLNKVPYYGKINNGFNFPIYSLEMPAGKLYVVTSPDIAREVQRNPKSLSFPWVEAIFGTRLAGMSKEGSALLLANVQGENGNQGLFVDGLKFLIKSLKPGVALEEMNNGMLRSLANTMSKYETVADGSPIDLWAWVRHLMILATTDATYGPQNPYHDPELEDAIWIVSNNVTGLLLSFFPNVFARQAFRAREKLTQAFENFYKSCGVKDASAMTKGRYESTKRELSLNDIARLDVVQGITILSNTVPSGFWTLYHVLSRPSVLNLVREEAAKILMVEERNGIVSRTLDVNNIHESPVLKSIMRESLRHQALGAGTRMVVHDTIIGNRYLLKKDCFVMLPNQPMHFNEQVWGSDVQDFSPLRFTKSAGSSQELAFRAFGGGANLCPGRFLATTEILSIVAMCALRFDIEPEDGVWMDPGSDFSVASSIVTPPLRKTMVRIRQRKGFETGSWAFKV